MSVETMDAFCFLPSETRACDRAQHGPFHVRRCVARRTTGPALQSLPYRNRLEQPAGLAREEREGWRAPLVNALHSPARAAAGRRLARLSTGTRGHPALGAPRECAARSWSIASRGVSEVQPG